MHFSEWPPSGQFFPNNSRECQKCALAVGRRAAKFGSCFKPLRLRFAKCTTPLAALLRSPNRPLPRQHRSSPPWFPALQYSLVVLWPQLAALCSPCPRYYRCPSSLVHNPARHCPVLPGEPSRRTEHPRPATPTAADAVPRGMTQLPLRTYLHTLRRVLCRRCKPVAALDKGRRQVSHPQYARDGLGRRACHRILTHLIDG
jgi:hypothetical protein